MVENTLIISVSHADRRNDKFVPVHANKTHVGVEVWLHAFLTLTLGGSEQPVPHSSRFISGERAPVLYCGGGSMELRAGLHV